MTLSARSIHKWIGIGLGLVMLLWLVSGVVMLLPTGTAIRRANPPDAAAATLSPAEAVQRLGKHAGVPLELQSIALISVGSRPSYHIIAGRRSYLLDAGTGELLRIDSAAALEIVGHELTKLPKVVRVEPIGPVDSTGVPGAFRVVLGDPAATWVRVSTRDGALSFTTSRMRFKNVMAGLHSFETLRVWYDSRRAQFWLIAGAATATGVAVVTGYWLWLLSVRRRKVKSAA